MSQYRLAVDTGGTFIDFVLLDERSGEVQIEKQASTPGHLAEQLINGLHSFNVPIAQIVRLFHGTTAAINALVQERGAKVGLITTAGFRDVLQIARSDRPDIYEFLLKRPAPIVPRYLRHEVRERLSSRGTVLEALDLSGLDIEVDALLAEGVETIAIAFLHAYVNPSHELLAREHIRARFPELPVSISSEIACEWREYERTSTTVLNAFIQPLMGNYLRNLARRLQEEGYSRPVAIMQSNGGVCSAEAAAAKPIRTMMSGPAGGVIGAKFLSDTLGHRNVICADVGGTTFDVALIEDGQILEKFETTVAGRPILGSQIDVTSIGAGGGSIAWIDERGALRVGPHSAGAHPGPVCFALGGEEPTVTDAQLVLGYIDAANFLGGRMRLEPEAARAALAILGLRLGESVEDTAAGVVSLAETSMSNAIRTKTIERGLDPREFVLLAYGGGGALFAAPLCEELDIPEAVVPRLAANFSAWGILASDYVEDAARTCLRSLDSQTLATVQPLFRQLAEDTRAALARYGFASEHIESSFRVDVRFDGQAFTIAVLVDAQSLEQNSRFLDDTRARFVSAHQRLYGHGDESIACEITTVRCRSVGRVHIPKIQRIASANASAASAHRDVFFPQQRASMKTAIFQRPDLAPGWRVYGPAIVEEWTTTTLVPPGWSATVDAFGNLILRRRGAL